MATAAVPQVAGRTITDLRLDPLFGQNGQFVLKVAYPMLTAPHGLSIGITDPVNVPQQLTPSHQCPAQNAQLDIGGTVTAILFGITV